ncbi:conserved domain protein [Actinomyces sp. oral taxon 170 str. F0386]|nr:conserved domain protein [Actinomyces sp. oral taxon 170 str. F0386]
MFMAESWHLPVRELQGGKALIGIIRSSVTSTCPARDVDDDLVSVFTQLTGPYQRRDLRPLGLLQLLGSPTTIPPNHHPEVLTTSLRHAWHSHVGHGFITLVRFLFPVQIPTAALSHR